MTSKEVLDYFVRDGRPASITAIGDWRGSVDPALVHGGGIEDALAILRTSPGLAYGSVVLISDLSVEDHAEISAKLAVEYFREWDKFGVEHYRAWVKSVDDLGYGSHQAPLVAAVLRTTGPVLELGAGYGSTPILHEICAVQGRRLVTVDSDPAWFRRFADLASPQHLLKHVPGEGPRVEEEIASEDRWAVVLVDHSPGERRGAAIAAAMPRADYVVGHDTEELGYEMEPALASFKYRRDFRKHRPWTTVASMTREVW